MAHNLTDQDTMFSVKERPWHGLGKVIHAAPTVAEGIKLAGLDWDVASFPLYTAKWGATDAAFEAVEAACIRRTDTGEILGHHVGPDWKPLQNRDAFDWFQPFIDSGLATLETAGSLFAGRRIWILAKIAGKDAEITPGDSIEKYLLLANSHDGSLAIRAGYTPIRVVCHNTLSAAIGKDPTTGKDTDKALSIVKIKHTKGSRDTLNDVQKAIADADRHFERTAQVFRDLATKAITSTEFKAYVRKSLALTPPAGKDELATRGANILDQVCANLNENMEITRNLFSNYQARQEITTQADEVIGAAVLEDILTGNLETGRGQAETQGAKGPTWWHAYNAVTEYLTHQRGRTAETRLDQSSIELRRQTEGSKATGPNARAFHSGERPCETCLSRIASDSLPRRSASNAKPPTPAEARC